MSTRCDLRRTCRASACRGRRARAAAGGARSGAGPARRPAPSRATPSPAAAPAPSHTHIHIDQMEHTQHASGALSLHGVVDQHVPSLSGSDFIKQACWQVRGHTRSGSDSFASTSAAMSADCGAGCSAGAQAVPLARAPAAPAGAPSGRRRGPVPARRRPPAVTSRPCMVAQLPVIFLPLHACTYLATMKSTCIAAMKHTECHVGPCPEQSVPVACACVCMFEALHLLDPATPKGPMHGSAAATM